MARIRLFLSLISLCFSPVNTLIVESIVGGAVLGCFGYLAPKVVCQFKECCTDKWIPANMTGLQSALRRRVFGQHLVTETVLKAIVGHLNNKAPNKALALSFNGCTGSGKKFVSKIIAEHIFKKGMDSNFVHQIIATHDFPHKSDVDFYKRQLRSLVAGSVSNCARSMFIFDEMDKMPLGLIDVLERYLDFYPDVEKVDFRRSIFIFLSNTGGHLINDAVLKHWKDGKKREDIGIKQMDKIINLAEFNSKGGLWHSSLIEKNLIDYFVPFMPLERSHIKMCARADLEQKGHPITEQNLNNIADEILYFPEDLKVFSQSGCEKVSSKVDYIMP